MRYNSVTERKERADIESQMPCAQGNNPGSQVTCSVIPFVTFWKSQCYRDRRQVNGLGWGQDFLAKGHEGMFLGWTNYFIF